MFTILDHSVSNQFFRRLRSALLLLSLAILLGLAFAPAEGQEFTFSVSDANAWSFKINFQNIPDGTHRIYTVSLPLRSLACHDLSCDAHYTYSPFSSIVWQPLESNTTYQVMITALNEDDFIIGTKSQSASTTGGWTGESSE